MANKIQIWSKYGPRILLGRPMEAEEIIENIVNATNQSKGSVLAELDIQILAGLKAGRIVRLPNGMRFAPIGKKDGSINISVQVTAEMYNAINASFRGIWINAENMGKTEEEMVEIWNGQNPEDQISLN